MTTEFNDRCSVRKVSQLHEFFLLAEASGIESLFTVNSLYVVAALVLIEGLLSVDNALAMQLSLLTSTRRRERWP